MYYQLPNNSDGRNNSDGWKGAWILIIALAGIIVLGEQIRLIFKNSIGWNNSIGWKKCVILIIIQVFAGLIIVLGRNCEF